MLFEAFFCIHILAAANAKTVAAPAFDEITVLGMFLAGLALFFSGLAGIKSNLQQMTTRRFRLTLAKWTEQPLLAATWGIGAGAITQSSSAVSFLLTGMISAGLIPVRKALPIVAWAHVGVTLLVFLAAIDIRLAIYYATGICGLMMAFQFVPQHRHLVAAMFYAALLFFGLMLMKDAFKPLPSFHWFSDFTDFIQGSVVAGFILGALLRMIIQSSSAIVVLAITLGQGGLFSEDQATMVMYGASVGVGLSVCLLSSNLAGVPLQISYYQAIINVAAGLTFFIIYYVQKVFSIPELSHGSGLSLDKTLALNFLILQTLTMVYGVLLSHFGVPWLERLAPPTQEQGMSKPHFIQESSLEDPETALDLADREMSRVLRLMPAYTKAAGADISDTDLAGEVGLSEAAQNPAMLHAAMGAVCGQVREYLTAVLEKELYPETSERLLRLELRLTLLLALEQNLFDFTQAVKSTAQNPVAAQFADSLAESLDAVLHLALDAAKSNDLDDITILLAATNDRGALMERLRRSRLSAGELEHQDKATAYYLTSLFERLVWMLRQIGLAMRQQLAGTESAPIA
ncbi:MAG TPA: Na/Pi symporter [Candidatus Methylacidiphilales bacterium]|nr:Na/Pi symporter [Candidatus Methylacidiphilales bacterium]